MRLKKSIRRGLCIFGTIAAITMLVCASSWANQQATNAVCTNLEVEIMNADSSAFVSKTSILNELARLNIDPVGKKMRNINTKDIEAALYSSEYLENVECVISNNHTLQIRATQLVPVMRVFDGNNSYYVNCHGKRMSATARFHVDVPVVNAHFTSDYTALRILPLIEYVENDKKLNSLVTMYSVRDSNNVFIVPCISGHVVNLGSISNLDNKFAKLKEFYTRVLPEKGWNYYDTISLKYDHQIVATRRVKSIVPKNEYFEDVNADNADIESMTIGNGAPVVGNAEEKNRKYAQPAAPAKPEMKKAEEPKPEAKNTETQKAEVKKAETPKKEAKASDTKPKTNGEANAKVKNAFKKN